MEKLYLQLLLINISIICLYLVYKRLNINRIPIVLYFIIRWSLFIISIVLLFKLLGILKMILSHV